MARFAWGTFCFILQFMPIVAFSSTGETAQFGCDNDRIAVGVEPHRSAIEINNGAGKGDYVFSSRESSTRASTRVIRRPANGAVRNMQTPVTNIVSPIISGV